MNLQFQYLRDWIGKLECPGEKNYQSAAIIIQIKPKDKKIVKSTTTASQGEMGKKDRQQERRAPIWGGGGDIREGQTKRRKEIKEKKIRLRM